MATAREAREWARDGLRGIGDSPDKPFAGVGGDDEVAIGEADAEGRKG